MFAGVQSTPGTGGNAGIRPVSTKKIALFIIVRNGISEIRRAYESMYNMCYEIWF